MRTHFLLVSLYHVLTRFYLLKIYIGITSSKLLDRAHEFLVRYAEAPRILHFDATYKLCFANFEVFVVGFSDKNSIFYLLGIFISSGKDAVALSQMFESIEDLWLKRYNEPFAFTHIMSDADTAMASFWSQAYSDRKLLMCYWHMKEAVSNCKISYLKVFLIYLLLGPKKVW